LRRRLFVASSIATALGGCAQVTNALNEWGPARGVLDSAQTVNHAIIGTRGMAKLYRDADVNETFPTNGLDTPSDARYTQIVRDDYATYRLPVSGLIEHPQTFAYPQLRALATLSQNTRHDCVEGWSVVGKFGGVPLRSLLALVRPRPQARYVVCYSFDRDQNGQQFYGSIDLTQAAHPQTMLALDLNGKRIDADHGGPVRLRIPTQLAYKSTKWIQRIEITDSFARIFGGKGGYWEDSGYEWYAGI